MKSSLLESAALKVLPTTGRENNISHVTVSLKNPFSAPLRIKKISSSVASHGITLGTIDTDTDFESVPNSITQSPELNFNMNFDPAALFTVTRVLAVEAGLDPAPIDAIVRLGEIQYLNVAVDQPPPDRRQDANLFTSVDSSNLYLNLIVGLHSDFDLPSYVQAAFKKLRSDVQLTSDVIIGMVFGELSVLGAELSAGDYETTLQFAQTGVPTSTDDSLDLILPILAQPIITKIVAGAGLGFVIAMFLRFFYSFPSSLDTVLISNPKQSAFCESLVDHDKQ